MSRIQLRKPKATTQMRTLRMQSTTNFTKRRKHRAFNR